MTPKEALDVLRGHGIDKANESWGAHATAIEAEVERAYSDLLYALKKADLL